MTFSDWQTATGRELDREFNAALLQIRDFLLGIDPIAAKRRWSGGPTVGLRGAGSTGYATYAGWIRDIEAGALGQRETAPQLIQRLRRLAYSVFTVPFSDTPRNPTPWMLDLVTRAVTPAVEPPLTTDHVSQAALDGLFGTATITLPDGSTVSPAHIWASADLAVNGASPLAAAGGLTLATNVFNMAGWLGDLSNALDNFAHGLEGRQATEPNLSAAELRTRMRSMIGLKASKAELLGDMDGLVLGRHWSRHPGFTLSHFFELYYKDNILLVVNPEQLGRPTAAHRFHYFLNEIDPALPISGRNSTPLVVTFDKVAARNALPAIVTMGVSDLKALSRLKLIALNPIDFVMRDIPTLLPIDERLGLIANAPGARSEFHFLCDEFCRFLDEGVQSRVAGWPF